MRFYRAVCDCGALIVSDNEAAVDVMLVAHRCLSALDLRPAPRPDCPTCRAFHERDHHCAVCSVLNRHERHRRVRSTNEQVIDLLRAGKSCQWVAANTGIPLHTVMVALDRLRGETRATAQAERRSA